MAPICLLAKAKSHSPPAIKGSPTITQFNHTFDKNNATELFMIKAQTLSMNRRLDRMQIVVLRVIYKNYTTTPRIWTPPPTLTMRRSLLSTQIAARVVD
jgi:hypothetical protein